METGRRDAPIETLSPGRFITLEGPDGAGKTTQAALLCAALRATGRAVLCTREPGGTTIGERIRQILLDEAHREMTSETEMLLFAAARAQLVREVIRPALVAGTIVVSSRYVDASLAYQGYGRGLDLQVVRAVNEVATSGLLPDLTVLIDVDPEAGLARARAAQRGDKKESGRGDRLEQESAAFYERVREGFIRLAHESPHRFVIVDGRRDVPTIHRAILEAVEPLLARR